MYCLSAIRSPTVTGYLLFTVLEMSVPSPQLTPSTVCVCVFILVANAQAGADVWCQHGAHSGPASISNGDFPSSWPSPQPQALTHLLPQCHQETHFSQVPGPDYDGCLGPPAIGWGKLGGNRGPRRRGLCWEQSQRASAHCLAVHLVF